MTEAHNTTPPTAPTTLEYGLAPPRRRKRNIRILVLLLAVALGCAGYKWGSDAWTQAGTMLREWQCVHYTDSPERVAYEEDPANVKQLLVRHDYVPYPLYRAPASDPTPQHSMAAVAKMPACWNAFRQWVPLASIRFPTSPGQSSGAILFLHGRSTPAGKHRLVCLRFYPETHSFTPAFIEGYNCESAVFAPSTWTTAPTQIRSGAMIIDVLSGFPSKPPRLRVYAGQVDPDDATHFTVRYEAWGQSDVLDCWVQNDDSIKMTPRKMPSQPR